MKTEHQKETTFLKQMIRYGDTAERNELEGRVTRAQGDESSVRRGVWLMVLLLAFCAAGLCYGLIFLSDGPPYAGAVDGAGYCQSHFCSGVGGGDLPGDISGASSGLSQKV